MRQSYLDDAKGLAIILMVFGHTMTSDNPVHMWIFSFHMPLFFIVGGILFALCPHPLGWKSEWDFIKRRAATAGIPYLFFGILLALFYSALNIVAHEPISLFPRLLRLVTLKGIDSLWFLPSYVLCTIIMSLTAMAGRNKQFLFSLVCFCLVCLKELGLPIPMGEVLFKVLTGVCFFETGILIGACRLLKKVNWAVVAGLFLVGFLLFPFNGPVEMAPGSLGNPFLYFICAICTSVSLIALFYHKSSVIDRILPFLPVYGRYSIVLVCTNNLLIEVIRLLDYKLTGNLLIRSGMIGSILFTIVLLLLEWQLIKIAQGKTGWIFGYLPKKRTEPKAVRAK